MAKILILIAGSDRPLKPILKAGEKLGHKMKGASFSRLEFSTGAKPVLRIDGEDLAGFKVIYLRVVARRWEEAALTVDYAQEKGIPVVDSRLPMAKSLEASLLARFGFPVPATYFGSLKQIREKGPQMFDFPFVIKGTAGKQGHAVWSPQNKEKMDCLMEELEKREKRGERFIAQEFIKASQRDRLLVVGSRVIGAITRPTRWRKRFLGKDAPSGRREAIFPLPGDEERLALAASKALGINIAGVDIIREDATGKLYVLEVNSAPRWVSIKKDTGVKVEEEIVKFLASRA